MAAAIALGNHGFDCQQAASPLEALEKVRHDAFDLLLLDMNFSEDTTSGKEGLNFLKQLQSTEQQVSVVVMTAWASVDLAVQAMQLGASDFVEKPWNNNRLLNVVQQQLNTVGMSKQNARLTALAQEKADTPFLAVSDVMQSLLSKAQRAAKSDASILITGENGTGKSLLAQFIHQNSMRSEQVFVSVNMGAIPHNLFESEMFGHKKGAFTDAKEERLGRFDIANGGTLFMDEVGTIPPEQQSKLLRVLETQSFEMIGSSQTIQSDVRVISATNCDLQDAIENKQFRQDLLFRLNTIELHIPPLRERIDDILPLAESMLNSLAKKYQRDGMLLSADAQQQLLQYHWPGNVRELNHCIERAVILAEDHLIESADLGLIGSKPEVSELPLMTLDEAEKKLLINAIKSFDGNVVSAGEFLGLTKSAVYRRLEKHGIDPKTL